MTKNLQKALTELEEAGAREVPEEKEILDAPSGTKWNGKKGDGYSWELYKRAADDFKVKC